MYYRGSLGYLYFLFFIIVDEKTKTIVDIIVHECNIGVCTNIAA